jgi:hypothetical protein
MNVSNAPILDAPIVTLEYLSVIFATDPPRIDYPLLVPVQMLFTMRLILEIPQLMRVSLAVQPYVRFAQFPPLRVFNVSVPIESTPQQFANVPTIIMILKQLVHFFMTVYLAPMPNVRYVFNLYQIVKLVLTQTQSEFSLVVIVLLKDITTLFKLLLFLLITVFHVQTSSV